MSREDTKGEMERDRGLGAVIKKKSSTQEDRFILNAPNIHETKRRHFSKTIVHQQVLLSVK